MAEKLSPSPLIDRARLVVIKVLGFMEEFLIPVPVERLGNLL
jgi:hypothetical protein